MGKLKRVAERAVQRTRTLIEKMRHERRLRKSQKIFCIGCNKTGTTSLEKELIELGYILGDQGQAELLYDKHYFNKNFEPIIEYCRTAEAFQDAPFSCPETYKHLDKAFPKSKFILSVRDDAEQWYRSLTSFHAKSFNGGKLPTYEVLAEVDYLRKGYVATIVELFGSTKEEPYQKESLLDFYNRHNEDVIGYFADRPDDLLIINLSKAGDYQRFLDFLGKTSPRKTFQWENKT
ncbi:MAG: sulfotransferase [Paracoccaceae bacterium]